jgi:TrmH family RNA methyltransferase
MAADTPIRSKQNPMIKRVGAVRAGLEPHTLILEGDRLVLDALDAGVNLEIVLVGDDRAEFAVELMQRRQTVHLVDSELMERISGLKTAPGSLALAAAPASLDLERIAIDEKTRILVAAGVADPGNLGALARSAEAFGARAVVVARGGASPWNERAVRGSMGSLLRLSVAHGLDAEAIARTLAARRVRQVYAATRGGADAHRFDWKGPIAIWVSGETGALPTDRPAFERVTIPMAPSVESLNVAVAAAILLFASGRTRSANDD